MKSVLTDLTENNPINTAFEYNLINELQYSDNHIGERTEYEYDLLGRMIKETHPDRGITESFFDNAGNQTKVRFANVRPNAGAVDSIVFAYDHNRMISKSHSVMGTINNTTYTYGTRNDGKNGAGRITQVVQGNDVLVENYKYDLLGNATEHSRKIAVPLAGEHTFVNKSTFDAWGRIQTLQYPDGEILQHFYHPTGELNAIKAELPTNVSFTNPHYLEYLSFSYYDGLGQKRALGYGNDVVTDFAYEPNSRLMQTVTLTTPKGSNGPATLMNKEIDYFANGNIKAIENDLSNSNNAYSGMDIGYKYSHTYDYDYANRLAESNSTLQTNANAPSMLFKLEMAYDEVGRILSKNQESGYNGDQTYQYNYQYNSSKPHQIDQVVDDNNVNDIYQYTARGGIAEISPKGVLREGFLWDPEDRLRAVKNNRQLNENQVAFYDVHHYIYDPNGTRLMKASLKHDYTAEDGQQLGATQHVLDPYTVYVSGNYVVKFYDEYADVSKHYYAGGQRIASKLWQWHYNPTANPSQDPITPTTPPAVQNNIVLEDLWDVITLWDSVLGTETPTLQELENMQLPTRAPFHKEPCTAFGDGYTGGEVNEDDEAAPPVSYNIPTLDHINCLCRNGENAFVWQNYGVSCHNFEELYFYHPDYLSNTEYVTDAGGYVYQYLFYSPFGESLYSQHAQTGEYNTPHRFNAKELDPETGNYYYGARYYNPKVSVWLSVDPLAHKYPSMSSYVFTGNNPVVYIDPDGKEFVNPSDYETAARAKFLVNNAIKNYEKDNASFSKKIDKINANKKWSAEKKASKIRDFEQLQKTNEVHIEILKDVVKGIDKMETSDKKFTFKESNYAVNRVSYKDGIVTIPYSSDANLIHESVHGGQIAYGQIGLSKDGEFLDFYLKGLSPLGAEVEAYKAQFSFDRNSMPLTKAGAFDNLESITPTSVKLIYVPHIDILGRSAAEYPYANMLDW